MLLLAGRARVSIIAREAVSQRSPELGARTLRYVGRPRCDVPRRWWCAGTMTLAAREWAVPMVAMLQP